MSFKSQLYAFVKRNFLLKYRNKLQTFSEIYTPILILAVLIAFSFLFPNQRLNAETYEAETFPPNIGSSIRSSSYLYIAPNDSKTKNLVDLINEKLKFKYIKYFEDLNSLEKAYKNDSKFIVGNYFAYGVDFRSDNFPYKYDILMQYSSEIYTNNHLKIFSDQFILCRRNSTNLLNLTYGGCAGNKYLYNGLSSLKFYTDLAIRTHYSNSTLINQTYIEVQNMPKNSAIQEQQIVTGISSYYFTLFFINSLVTFVTNLVHEKENKSREMNKIMGMYDSVFWLSWIIVYLIPLTILNLIISIVLFAINFFTSFNLTVVFFFLIQLFSLTTISFGMVFTTLFKKSKTAGSACGGLI
jgi:ATP-binding cassette, subfamily A (ABC1), member 5